MGSLRQVTVVGGKDAVEILHENPVIGGFLQALLGDPTQERLGVVAAGTPEILIESREQPAHLPVPAVQQIIGEFFEAFKLFRNAGLNFQREACSRHG
jgi:hypothetical protein